MMDVMNAQVGDQFRLNRDFQDFEKGMTFVVVAHNEGHVVLRPIFSDRTFSVAYDGVRRGFFDRVEEDVTDVVEAPQTEDIECMTKEDVDRIIDDLDTAYYSTVTVAGVPYEIESVEGLLESGIGALGLIRYEAQKIYYDASLPDQRRDQTILHELVHAMFYESGFGEHDEDVIERLALTMFRTIKDDNGEFFRDIGLSYG